MIFFFKKKPLVLNCVTNRHEVMSYAPIKKASAFYPDWWKQLPKTYVESHFNLESTTMKSCIGMRDLFQHGAILPLWSDFFIDVGPIGTSDFRFLFSDRKSRADLHSPQQRGEYAPEHLFSHIKLFSPWMLQCEEDVPFMWTEPTWNMANPTAYRILPATVSYKYQFASHINIIFPRAETEKRIEIPFGTPMAHLIPISDRPVQINLIEDVALHTKLQDELTHIKFINMHSAIKAAKQGSCPFTGRGGK